MPSTVAVVEDATHGPILFCSGVNHHVADPEAAEAYWGPGLRKACGARHFIREHAIDAQLRPLGTAPRTSGTPSSPCGTTRAPPSRTG
ncbi:hypothetical protein ACFUZA_19975 [Streptomyces cellulosae]|uniref:hypothetical protein n=1 Tax=Streptomyces cellulosae TaxID=1968 RepID=UPI0036C496CB